MIVAIREDELVAQLPDLMPARLHRWIRLGWVRPERVEGMPVYRDVDVARVRLLRDLESRAEFDEDTLVMVLSLLDQVHDLRFELRNLAAAINLQAPDVRDRIMLAYQRILDAG